MTYLDGNSSIENIIGRDNVIDEREKEEKHTSSELIEYFKKLNITASVEKVGADAVFGRNVNIYKLN